MAFEFIKGELCEARYIWRDEHAVGRSGFELAETFFMHLIMLQQLRFENPQLAEKYAETTLKYVQFRHVTPAATDLHNLAAILNNKERYGENVTDLQDIELNVRMLKRYLRMVVAQRDDAGFDRRFFLMMQRDLRVRTSFLKRARRIAADYGTAKHSERKAVTARLLNMFKHDGLYRSDLYRIYLKTIQKHGLVPDDPKKGMPAWAKYAATIGGLAVAGYALGRKYG